MRPALDQVTQRKQPASVRGGAALARALGFVCVLIVRAFAVPGRPGRIHSVNTVLVLGYGALGGSIRGVLAMYGAVETWVLKRRKQHEVGGSGVKVPLSQDADWPAELTAAAAQIVLGALAGILLYRTGTVTTAIGVILGGISAPAILYQLGQVKSVRGAVFHLDQQSPAKTGDELVKVEVPRSEEHAKDEQASA
jgi:hypothetical protein